MLLLNHSSQIEQQQSHVMPCYRLNYQECHQSSAHRGQILNYICLNPNCVQNSLICSLCRDEAHKGHKTLPLKFYLEQLKKNYENDEKNYGEEIEKTQNLKAKFLNKLNNIVEKISHQLAKLEDQVVTKFNSYKKYLVQKNFKKQNFQQFYEKLMKNGKQEELSFLINSYLPTKVMPGIKNTRALDSINTQFARLINDAKNKIITSQQQEEIKEEQQLDQYLALAPCIKRSGSVFTQMNLMANNTKNMSILKVNLSDFEPGSNIKLKITKLKKGSMLYFGAISQKLCKQFDHTSPVSWKNKNYKNQLFYLNNFGASFGSQQNTFKFLHQYAIMETKLVDNKLRISMKNNTCDFTLPRDKKFYFFFSLCGASEVAISLYN